MRLAPLLILLALAPLARGEEISERDATRFAKAIEKSISARDLRTFSRYFDNRAVIETAVQRADAPQGAKDSFIKGAVQGFDLGNQISTALKDDGSYTFLRLARDPLRLRFRVLLPEGGVNYHDLSLARDAAGKLRVVDAYVYISGEALTVTLRRAFRSAMASQGRGDGAFLRGAKQVERAQKLYAAGKPAQALKVLDGLKGDWATMPNVLTMKVLIAVDVDEAALVKATDAYERALPDSPALHLVLVDKLILQKKWKKVFKRIDSLETLVGGDPFLNVLRANCHTLAGDPVKSKVLLKQAVKDEPTLKEAHFALADLGLTTEDWELVAAELIVLERDFDVEWGDLSQVEGFAGFAKSKAYKTWLKRKANQKKPSKKRIPARR